MRFNVSLYLNSLHVSLNHFVKKKKIASSFLFVQGQILFDHNFQQNLFSTTYIVYSMINIYIHY